MFNFEEELKKAPEQPGVYLMHDKNDNVIYVGKAIILRNRLRSYFRGSHIERTTRMIEQIDRFEYIVTDSEYEALLLECTLIKKYKPKYNVLLKDDKNFPYIRVTVNEPFPRIMLARKVAKDGARYFGPYLGTYTVENAIDTVRRAFPTRLCSKKITEEGGHDRPCLNFHIGLCPGPCGGKVSQADYGENVNNAMALLSGKTDETEKLLKEKMLAAASAEDFETAAVLRERLKAVTALKDRQKIVRAGDDDCDIIAVAQNEKNSCLQIFFFRNGNINGRNYFMFENTQGILPAEIIMSFLGQFYTEERLVPPEIYVECEIDEKEGEMMSRMLSSERTHQCRLIYPQKGEKRRLAEMVKNNAVITLENFELSGRHKNSDRTEILEKLAAILELQNKPERIEAFDISNLGNSEIDASMVVFVNGNPDRNMYRHFKMQSLETRNDVGSVFETLTRRLVHLSENDEKFGGKPDLFLIDGGRGQVEAALSAVKNSGFDIPVCGMVKDDHHKTRGLYFSGREYVLKNDPEMWHFISAIQNEAHRFAITYNRKLTEKRYRESELDHIPGVGESRRILLYRALGSLPAIKGATREELAAVKGISVKLADKIYEYLHKEETK